MEELQSVVREVDRVCSSEAAAGGDVAARVRLLIDDVQRHDLKETQLLQSAYWREVGVGD
jgi:hypothetical protein